LGRIDQEIAVGALGPYVEHSDSAAASRILWSADLFSLDDRPALPANGAIDITGRPRCLLQGPHVVLPPGSWLLALTLGFSRETADHEFLVEILTDRQLASSNLRPHHEGDWTAELSFMIDGS